MRARIGSGGRLSGYTLLTIATAASTLALIAIGGVVRTTESGLGCPDWPLCHGGLLPPLERAAIIEYTHRTAASIVGLLILSVAAWTLWRHRADRALAGLALASLPLLAVQAWLGKEAVERELPAVVVTLHLATGLLLFAVVTLQAALAWLGPGRRRIREPEREHLLRVAAWASAVTLIVLIAGSYLVGEGGGPACTGWPGCPEAPIPFLDGSRLHDAHWLHRVTVLIGGVAVAAVAWSAAGLARVGDAFRLAAASLVVLYLAQVVLGAANIWTDHSAAVRTAHLALAAALWGLLVTMAVAGRFEAAVPAEERPPEAGGSGV